MYRGTRLDPAKTLDEVLHDYFPDKSDRDKINAVPATENTEDLRLFLQLCPYFNGTTHLEEIMYYENVKRQLLLQLIDKYSSILITHVSEDKNINNFYKRAVISSSGEK